MALAELTDSEASFDGLYLDDYCEEIEIECEDEDEQQTTDPCATPKRRGKGKAKSKRGPTTKKRRLTLNKEEKARVLLSIHDVTVENVVLHVDKTLTNARHILDNKARQDLWKSLHSSKQIITELLKSLVNLFAALYKHCDKGKDKYLRFQLEWHRCCSFFLLPSGASLSDAAANPPKEVNLICVQQQWAGYCEGLSVEKSVRDAIMVSLCSAVHDYLLRRVCDVQKSLLTPESSVSVSSDIESVYYRFCGAAIASMLHSRYTKCQTCKNEQKIGLDQEILVLKSVQCVDKSHVPEELQYRDRGHMYFPSKKFLTFLSRLDRCVMENANDSAFKKYGPDIIKVAVKKLETAQEFQQQFKSLITTSLVERNADVNVPEFETAITNVYKELSRKLCHTRLAEFISATQQNLAAAQGKSTLAGQNLRDELLASHVKTKSLLH